MDTAYKHDIPTSTTKLAELLADLGACTEAQKWVIGRTLPDAWQSCERADWMLWLVGKMADKEGWPSRKQVVFAACQCARTALKHLPEGELRPLRAIETAEAWTKGEATLDRVRNAAYAAAYAAAAYAAAAYAAAAYADDAAYAAAAAAAADAYDAAYDARNVKLKELAELVRKHIPEVPEL